MKRRIPMLVVATLLVAFSFFCGTVLVRLGKERQPSVQLEEVEVPNETTKAQLTTTEESDLSDKTSTKKESATTSETLTSKASKTSEEASTTSEKKKTADESSNDSTNSSENVATVNNGNNNNDSNGYANEPATVKPVVTTAKKVVSQVTTKTSAITKKITTEAKKQTTKQTSKITTATTVTTTETEPVVTDPPLTPVDPSYELFGAYYGLAEETLKNMTLEEKVGQMFLVSYPGYNVAMNQIAGAAPAGYVLFARDFQYSNPTSIRGNMDTLKSNSKYGLMLGCDEEGGGVVRFSMYTQYRATRFQSPLNLFKQGGLQAIFDEAAEKADMMKNLGLNYNLAPVVDMPRNSWSYIYGRSLGQDAATTAEFSSGVVNIWNEHGMMATLKHFPGYADNVDTHTGVAVDNRSAETFWNEDLQPFISGANAGVPMIMVNHNIINCWDGTRPASLSEAVHNVLRYDIGYTGLIITDGLTMGAVKSYATNGEAAVQAVLCGNDMICTEDFYGQYREVLNAVKDGRIPEEMVNNAVRRVLACKYTYGVL